MIQGLYDKYIDAAEVTLLDLTIAPDGTRNQTRMNTIVTFTQDLTSEVDPLSFFRPHLARALTEKLSEIPSLVRYLSLVHARWLSSLEHDGMEKLMYASIAKALCPLEKPSGCVFPQWTLDSLNAVQPASTDPTGVGTAITLIANNPPFVYAAVAVLHTRLALKLNDLTKEEKK
jgi:hypothetical protein